MPIKHTAIIFRLVFKTLGIEAARQCIFNEINEAFEANGNYINYHHIALLCDRMCATKKWLVYLDTV